MAEFTDEQQHLLDGAYLAVLATVGPDGRPHTAPMWYVRDGNSLLVLTGRRSQKNRNIERDPRVSIVIDDRSRPYRAIMIDCAAESVDLDVDQLRSQLSARYMNPNESAAYVDSRRGAHSIALRLIPQRISEYISTV